MQSAQGSGEKGFGSWFAEDTRMHLSWLVDALRRTPTGSDQSTAGSRDLAEVVRVHRVKVVVLVQVWTKSRRAVRALTRIARFRSRHSRRHAAGFFQTEAVLQAFRAGQRDFQPTRFFGTLSKCILSVCEGQIWANNSRSRFAVEALASSPVVRAVDSNGLSLLRSGNRRCSSLVEGLTNREIATRWIEPAYHQNYLFRVYDKLGVSSRSNCSS